jgi:hypothetical protein
VEKRQILAFVMILALFFFAASMKPFLSAADASQLTPKSTDNSTPTPMAPTLVAAPTPQAPPPKPPTAEALVIPRGTLLPARVPSAIRLTIRSRTLLSILRDARSNQHGGRHAES